MKSIKSIKGRPIMKLRTGLFIGRFQPFHLGHLYVLQKSKELFRELIIGIGSTDKTDTDNPFSYTSRKHMVEKVLQHENLSNFVKKIVALNDNPDDSVWLKETLAKTGKIDAVVGNNEWVNGIFEHAGYKIIRLPFYKRELYEGIQIRKLMKSGGKWDDRVPQYLKDIIVRAKSRTLI